MSDHVCPWCGKHWGNPNTVGEGWGPYHGYCSARCEHAARQAKREEEAVRQQEREARRQRLAEIEAEGGFPAKLLKIWRIIKWTFWIVVILGVLLAILTGNK